MADVSILDLFWFILKLLVALGMVAVLSFVVFLICKATWKMLLSFPSFITGRATTSITVMWVLVVVGLLTVAAVSFSFISNNRSGLLPNH